MAIKLADAYVHAAAVSADYPGGSFQNASAPGALDGTPFEEQWANDQLGFFQALLSVAGVVPSGAPDTAQASQYLEAMQALMWSPGDYKWCSYSTPRGRWLECNGGTIGNAASVGTARANADTAALFAVLWAEPAASYPMLTSVGVPQARGASAAADFAAGHQITIPDMRGMHARGWDHGRGVDAGRVNGSYQADEVKAHSHTGTLLADGGGVIPSAKVASGALATFYTTEETGGPENTVKNIAGMYVIRY